MLSLGMVLISIILFIIAYKTYGTYLANQWGIDPSIPTPAHTREDGVDFVPAKPQVLLGHHFASIAGAGPINGPIQAAVFGWVPVLLWIIIGGIFFGGVHDYGSLTASMKNNGKSVGTIVEDYMGNTGKTLFSAFAWLTLVLVVAAFGSIVAQSFESTPVVATASILFMVEAIIFGYFVYRKGANLGIATVIGVIVLFCCIYIAQFFPIQLSATTWTLILGIYAFIASTAPVWILLQPRDYLNSFLLYTMMIGAVVGIIIARPEIQLESFAGFKIEAANGASKFLFPTLFITVACGAISGFHATQSPIISRCIETEKDGRKIFYGAMVAEGIIALIWASAGIAFYKGTGGLLAASGGNSSTVYDMSIGLLGKVGGVLAMIGVIVCPITSGDTAFRSARLTIADWFKIDQTKIPKRLMLAIPLLGIGYLISLIDYSVVWRYFSWSNQT
ncbi:MAG: carbon starvation protein A, partial [Bacilli bacterium]|nr:carbon starvation protein A [Bacilli bacterium]MDY5832299.1 carbon starvation protein A [Candidatus Onthovivens sp.]